MKKYFLLLTLTAFAFSCNKDGSSLSNSIEGTWTIKSQISGAFPYPFNNSQLSWNYANPNSVIVSGYNSTSLYLKFDQSGNYILTEPFGQPPVFSSEIPVIPPVRPAPITGTYKIVQDSFLIIQSDTSYLLKSTYNFRANAPFPNRDTIRFKMVSYDSLIFQQRWITSNIYQPQDPAGKLLFVSLSGLKKIQ